MLLRAYKKINMYKINYKNSVNLLEGNNIESGRSGCKCCVDNPEDISDYLLRGIQDQCTPLAFSVS